jgi:DNA-binding winged helix-turn-helix (wHTH) protein/TolB-like protein
MLPIHSDLRRGFQLGAWQVIPERGLLVRGNTQVHLEPLVVDVLLMLARNQGSVVSKDQLVEHVWRGRATADDAIAAKISALRKALGDDSKNPVYLETVQKRGYRMLDSVAIRAPDAAGPEQPARSRVRATLALGGLIILGIAAYVMWPDNSQIRSVAVIQFKNLSQDVDRFQYIVDGFAEELVISLDQVPNLRFIRGAGTVSSVSPREIARKLNVDAIVTGSLRTDGNRLRVTVEMISASGFQLWADRYDGASRDIFNIQERVASGVRNMIVGDEQGSLQSLSRPANAEAFDAYMRGLYFLAKRDPASLGNASALFEETMQLDPGFGPAYLREAITALLMARYNTADQDEIYDHALAIAAAGVEADPGIRESMQLVYGFVSQQRGDWKAAVAAYRRALQAGTVYPIAYQWYSTLLGDIGLAEQSLEQALVARELEPESPSINSRVAIAYLWNNDMENARHHFRIANAMGIGVPDHYLAYTLFLMRDNRVDEARASAKTAIDLAQSPSWWIDMIFNSLANPNDPQLRKIALATIELVAADESAPAYIPMVLWMEFGQADRGMELAQRWAARTGTLKNLELVYQPEFAAFRRQPGFPALLAGIGLTQYWSDIGCQWTNDTLVCSAA